MRNFRMKVDLGRLTSIYREIRDAVGIIEYYEKCFLSDDDRNKVHKFVLDYPQEDDVALRCFFGRQGRVGKLEKTISLDEESIIVAYLRVEDDILKDDSDIYKFAIIKHFWEIESLKKDFRRLIDSFLENINLDEIEGDNTEESLQILIKTYILFGALEKRDKRSISGGICRWAFKSLANQMRTRRNKNV